MIRSTLFAVLLSWTGLVPIQAPSPGDIADMLQLRMYQRELDRQRERAFSLYEAAYDREMCRRAGKRGQDVELCVQDSAAWRRGVRPNQPDLSQYGTPLDDEPVCIEQGHGIHFTRDCF